MNRRKFLYSLAFLFSSIKAFSQVTKTVNIKMNGQLDDDLIINRYYYNEEKFKSIICYQMHNFTRSFIIGSQKVKSIQIPGFIKFNKDIEIEDNSIIAIFTANEREDRDSRKKLTFRTHYKSAPLYINDKKLFPSLIPEENDVPGYTTWYGEDEENMSNYYKLWENSVVLSGFITHITGNHEIVLFNEANNVIGKSNFFMSNNEVKKIDFKFILEKEIINNHIFTEIDGNVYYEDGADDNFIKLNAVTKILISNSQGTVSIDLPYPSPYINTYYIKHTKG